MKDSNDPAEISRQNHEMLQELVKLIRGDGPDFPGLAARLTIVERVLFGKENSGGLVVQMQEMRRWRTWIMATLSAGAGVALTLGAQAAARHFHLI